MVSRKAREFMGEHISRHRKKYKMPPKQAVAVAYSEAREKGYKVPERHNPRFGGRWGYCFHCAAFHFFRSEREREFTCQVCHAAPPEVGDAKAWLEDHMKVHQ